MLSYLTTCVVFFFQLHLRRSGMEEGVFKRRGGDHCPQLLDLIPNDPLWRVRDDGGGGRCKFAALGGKDLELKLGPPGGGGGAKVTGYFSKHSTNTTALCSGAKRGFPYTAGIKQEGNFNVKKYPKKKRDRERF